MSDKVKTPQTATQAYAQAHTEIDALLQIIRDRLPSVDCRNASWDDAATVQQVRRDLTAIAIFLTHGQTEAEIVRVVRKRS